MRPFRRVPYLACIACVLSSAAVPAEPVQPVQPGQKALDVPPLLMGEGALQNDSFLPGAAPAAKKIAEGDRAFAKARAAGADAYDEALDAWHAALGMSALDDALVGDADGPSNFGALCRDPDRSLARRAEAIECAVERRVMSLDPKLLDLWSARFEALASGERQAAGADSARLERIVHDHPLTRAAARAGIQLFDLAFEGGDLGGARACLDRARRNAGVGRGPDPAVSAALARRTAALHDLEGQPRGEQSSSAGQTDAALGVWANARHIRLLAQTPLRTPPADEQRVRDRRPRSGIAFLKDDSVVVQNADTLFVVRPPGTSGAAGSAKSVDLVSSAAELALTFSPTFSDPRADLAARPASDGEVLVIVAGRALGPRGNALLCFERGPDGNPPRLVWGYGDQTIHVAGEATKPLDEVLEPGVWEFQPGPVIDGDRVLVQARQWTGEGSRAAIVDEGKVRAWCLALDLATGVVRWKRWLAAGALLEATGPQRTTEARGAARPAAPLGLYDGHVFVSTDLGIGSLLDTTDGRLLWSVRNSRRSSDATRRDAALPPIIALSCGSEEVKNPFWLWAPDDSNCVYRMRDGADLDGRGIFVAAPGRLRPAEEILAGDACQLLGSDPSAGQRSLWMEDARSGARSNSVPLEREESAPEGVLLAPGRALFATDRALYFCDRERELALLERIVLKGASRRDEPALALRRDRLYAADRSTLWIFGAE